ncbi:MAG: tetratricopeptide repeat protein, partial [Terracidiphilus sp.]
EILLRSLPGSRRRPLPSVSRNAYNQPVVHTFSSSRSGLVLKLAAVFGLSTALALCVSVCARAQSAAEVSPAAGEHGRILLVLPFDNRTGQPSLEWIREAAAEILSSRLASAGFAPMSRADRMYALDHLGLPQHFHPSRASSLKLAETLDADSIIVGSYVTDGSGIVAEAQLVDVPHLRMSASVSSRGEMSNLIPVFDSLAWKLTRQLDPAFKVSEETFVAADSGLSLAAFEQYIRGITESDQQERLRHLNQSVLLSPQFSPAWMALGREDYSSQQYEQAAKAFAKVGSNNASADDALEAGFFRGLSLLFSGDYPHAQEAFADVARVLPLAEVLNNQGVALARSGQDGIALFRQAEAADPDQADYHFNLSVSLKRRANNAEAQTELAECLRLRPNDTEAQAVLKSWTELDKPGPVKTALAKSAPAKTPDVQEPAKAGDAGEEPAGKSDPLERIERTFDAAAFHQAAVMMDQMAAAHLAALPPPQRAQMLSAQAHEYLDHGLLLEAERLYQAAVAADPKIVAAHTGLAEIRLRDGDAQAARNEAVTSLELMPSVDAYLVLARLDLAANHRDEALHNVRAALQIDSKSKAALDLWQQIEAGGGQKK